mgnify:CR=1 FL=1
MPSMYFIIMTKMLQITFKKQAQSQVVLPKQTTSFSLNDVVLHGLKDEVKKATETALESQDGLTIVNDNFNSCS